MTDLNKTLLDAADFLQSLVFVGEESLAGARELRMATATTITACTTLKIERVEMLRVLHEQHAFSDLFLKFLLARNMQTQADLVDQLFNSSEKTPGANPFIDAGFGNLASRRRRPRQLRGRRWRR